MAPAASVMAPVVLDTYTNEQIRLFKTSQRSWYQRQLQRAQSFAGPLCPELHSLKPMKPVNYANEPLTHLGNLGEGEARLPGKPPRPHPGAAYHKHVPKANPQPKLSREAAREALLNLFQPAPIPEGDIVMKWAQNLREVNERMRLDGIRLMSPYNMRKPKNPAWFIDFIDLPVMVEKKPDPVVAPIHKYVLALVPSPPPCPPQASDQTNRVRVKCSCSNTLQEAPISEGNILLKWAQNLHDVNQRMRLDGIRLISPYNMRKPKNPAWFIDFIDLPVMVEKKPDAVVAHIQKEVPALVPSPPLCLRLASDMFNSLKKKHSRSQKSLIPCPVPSAFKKYKVLPPIRCSD